MSIVLNPSWKGIDESRQQINELASRATPSSLRALNLKLGQRLEVELMEHFRLRDQEPNKRSWPKQHFWSRMREATALSYADQHKATVVIADPAMAAKIYGATIRPKERQWLALAVMPQFYGASPTLFDHLNLFFLMSKGRAWLAYTEGKELRLAYRLLESVTIPKDPRALPDEQTLHDRLREVAVNHFEAA